MIEAESAQLRMAVVGCGPIGHLHARGILESPGASLVAVCDSDPRRAHEASKALGVKTYSRFQELLRAESIDAVTIATPDDLHVDLALEAVSAGCHVFCEKPLATTRADAERMVEAASARGVRLGVDYNRRFGFGYRHARTLLDAGRVGAVTHAVIHVVDRPARPEVARVPHAILTSLITHHIDLMRFLCGEIVSVHASFGQHERGSLVRDVVLSCQIARGAVGAIVAGYRDGFVRTSERMEIEGTAGSLAVVDVTREVTVALLEPDRFETIRPNSFVEGDAFHETVRTHVRSFVASLVEGREPPVTGLDGLRGMIIAEAALESYQRGRPIEV
jgi:predicted dehydrogenase